MSSYQGMNEENFFVACVGMDYFSWEIGYIHPV